MIAADAKLVVGLNQAQAVLVVLAERHGAEVEMIKDAEIHVCGLLRAELRGRPPRPALAAPRRDGAGFAGCLCARPRPARAKSAPRGPLGSAPRGPRGDWARKCWPIGGAIPREVDVLAPGRPPCGPRLLLAVPRHPWAAQAAVLDKAPTPKSFWPLLALRRATGQTEGQVRKNSRWVTPGKSDLQPAA